MTRRRQNAGLVCFAFLFLSTIVGFYVWATRRAEKPPFVDPIPYCAVPEEIWQTGGWSQYAPCVLIPRQQNI